MSVIVDLVTLYESAGFGVRTNLAIHHFPGQRHAEITFTHLFGPNGRIGNMSGIAFAEIAFFEALCERAQPRSIFIVGNAFGWSTLALGLINPNAKVVAIDHCPTPAQTLGLQLTNALAKLAGLDARALKGESPNDVAAICGRAFTAPIDLVFIDGEHTPAQLAADFLACRHVAGPDCVYVFHDIVDTGTLGSFLGVTQAQPDLSSFMLMRTPSGMGLSYPKSRGPLLDPVVRAFGESEQRMNVLRAASARARQDAAK